MRGDGGFYPPYVGSFQVMEVFCFFFSKKEALASLKQKGPQSFLCGPF